MLKDKSTFPTLAINGESHCHSFFFGVWMIKSVMDSVDVVKKDELLNGDNWNSMADMVNCAPLLIFFIYCQVQNIQRVY